MTYAFFLLYSHIVPALSLSMDNPSHPNWWRVDDSVRHSTERSYSRVSAC